MDNRFGFEYRNKRKEGETVFETFLRYTDEKEKSSAVLGKILSQLLIKKNMTFLDVGSGNGEYLRLSFGRVKRLNKVDFTLLEPSADLARQLRLTTKRFPRNAVVKVVRSTFEDFSTNKQFDVVLASHVPLAKDKLETLPAVYKKMLKFLKPDGCLIVVLRGRDDVHEFRTVFKSQLTGGDYKSVTIDDAAGILKKIAKKTPLRISMFSAKAKLYLPYPDNMRDVISIIEFFLNRKWEAFPDDIREAALIYIRRKKGIFRQIDGFVVVKRVRY